MSTARRKTCKIQKGLCIGILTLPHTRASRASHIMKTYVDWFENRGVHVVPIPFDTKDPELYFETTNGLFIPGTDRGYDMKSKTLMKTLMRFVQLSMQPDEYYPIWGTCFGFQLLMQLFGGSHVLSHHDSNGLSTIHVTPEGKKSKMMKGFSKRYLHQLEHSPSTLQYHEYGISPSIFLSNPGLRQWFHVLATAIDDKGKEFVTAVEGKHYPLYGVQSHPERQKNSAPFLTFFLSELRQNIHQCHHLPYLRSLMKPQRCEHYAEQKDMLCYYF
jgi:gamma-glutamyl hydrolase